MLCLAVTKTTTREKFGNSLDPKKNIISEKNALPKIAIWGRKLCSKMLDPKKSSKKCYIRIANLLPFDLEDVFMVLCH